LPIIIATKKRRQKARGKESVGQNGRRLIGSTFRCNWDGSGHLTSFRNPFLAPKIIIFNQNVALLNNILGLRQ
jgi:hypothetical protein